VKKRTYAELLDVSAELMRPTLESLQLNH